MTKEKNTQKIIKKRPRAEKEVIEEAIIETIEFASINSSVGKFSSIKNIFQRNKRLALIIFLLVLAVVLGYMFRGAY